MTKQLCIATILLSLSSFPIYSLAQIDSEMNSNDKNESIIITKKGDVKEKFTIVIDGNNVSINGKPVDEFNSENVDIIKGGFNNNNWDVEGEPPFAFGDGASQGFNRNFMRSISSNKAFLGVMTSKTKEGATITDVTKESAAEKAGLKEGDIITKIGNEKVTGPDDLYKVIGKYKPEENVEISYLRDGKEAVAKAQLGKNIEAKVFSWNGDEGPGFNFDMPEINRQNFSFPWNEKPRLGIQVQDTEDDKGVKVLGVDEESAAEKAGFMEEDIITKINSMDINSTEDLKKITKDAKPGDTFTVTFKRNAEVKTTTIRFPKELKTIDL